MTESGSKLGSQFSIQVEISVDSNVELRTKLYNTVSLASASNIEL